MTPARRKMFEDAFANERKLKETIKLLLDYVDLLGAELDELALFAANRGWKSSRAEEGKRIRQALGITEEE